MTGESLPHWERNGLKILMERWENKCSNFYRKTLPRQSLSYMIDLRQTTKELLMKKKSSWRTGKKFLRRISIKV
jgi:hypothetical protein